MESAAVRRQSLPAAVLGLPGLLSASRAVGVPELAMMGDYSPSKRGWVMDAAQAGIGNAWRVSFFGTLVPYGARSTARL
jgi:hypothetical protein